MIRKADDSDAVIIHDMMSAIPWISETTKTADGLAKVTEFCNRGDIFVSTIDGKIAALMVLQREYLAADFGHNLWSIPLVTTIESERRKGHARMLITRAKQIAGNGVIQAHAQNDNSRDLLISEGFVHVDGETDVRGHPLYQWSSD
ncbi:MAG TPA: hypothetical protein VJO12_09180 [Stellaceae bacterium]|nr:hypothetical protein [Stellaceae bacterium]